MEILFLITLGVTGLFIFLYLREKQDKNKLEEDFTNAINKIVEDYEYSITTYKQIIENGKPKSVGQNRKQNR